MKTTLVFDVDETLIVSNWTYDEAYTAYFNFLYNRIKGRIPSLHDLYDRFFEIEAELAPTWGIKRGRVAESMALHYREVCNWILDHYEEARYDADDESYIREIGDRPFNYRNHLWLPRVRKTLGILKNKGYILCVLTSYDTKLFLERAKYLGLDEFFDQGRMLAIDGKKTPADFISVSQWNSSADGRWYSIGNGESDIRPALNISESWHGIYIPHRSTSPFFKRSGRVNFDAVPMDHPRVINIIRFSELLNHL